MNFYNDNDPKICAWLRELIAAKLIPDGVVDSRSITLIQPHELKSYTQCHFFAGIGGWSEALRLAGWPSDKPVWTGSCPCQPYSCAGKRKGNDDPRNVWPHFRNLIAACQPPVVFGEQVASKAGREWLSGVFADLEALGYSRAGADLCAAGVGAPHIRQRLYWIAHTECSTRGTSVGPEGGNGETNTGAHDEPGRCGYAGGVAYSIGQRRCSRKSRCKNATDAWQSVEAIFCLDGKSRRTQSGICPLAHGVQARVVRLRGYGNAIVPQVAAEFIKAAALT